MWIARRFCYLVLIFLPIPSIRADSLGRKAYCGNTDPVSCAGRLLADGRYQTVTEIFPAAPGNSADLDFCRGMALAGLGRLEEARRALEAGQEKASSDKRFPLELAGVAFKLGDESGSRRFLKRALKADPQDSYGNDFLATLYFLQGNLEASLKYWNRVGKPRIENVETVPSPKMDPSLLDRSLAFSPASTLTLNELVSTRERLEFTDVFPAYRFELAPKQDGSFDLRLHVLEGDAWGDPLATRLLSIFREVPYQTIHFDLFDIGGSARNLESSYRWDAQKRRLFAAYSSPLKGSSRLRLRLWLDGRNENWNVPRSSSTASSPLLFKLKKLEAGAGVAALIRDRWEWKTGVSLSDRRFLQSPLVRSVPSGLFDEGLSLKYEAGLRRQLFDLPERRFRADALAKFLAARALSKPADHYARMDLGLNWDWLPQSRGDDYHLSGRLRIGEMLGQPPLDELYSLGLERDNDLYMRGHSGTIDGMKGAGPLGRSLVLLNCDMDKIIHDGGLWRITLGPFLDTGRVYDGSAGLGSRKLLWDAGVQSKISILGKLSFALSYGWDLRAGKSAFYSGVLGSSNSW